MRNSPRPRCREVIPPQDALKAFLAKAHIGGLFYHILLAQHLARAGFEARQVEKENNHAHVWVVKLRRGRVPAGLEIAWVKKQICLFLKRYGLRYPKKEVVAMVEGERVTVAFNWQRGKPGWLVMWRRKVHPERLTRGPS